MAFAEIVLDTYDSYKMFNNNYRDTLILYTHVNTRIYTYTFILESHSRLCEYNIIML